MPKSNSKWSLDGSNALQNNEFRRRIEQLQKKQFPA